MKVLAAAAHPDDIEFMMAGTLLRLKDAGCEIHLWNLANGCCGSACR
jgi:LmbE family N-acetylglucosaminyl deacetylase